MFGERLRPHATLLCLLPCVLTLLGACSDSVDDARRPWLRSYVIDENRALFERSPALTEGKMMKMASGLYPWFRGTLGVFHADTIAPNPGALPTRYGSPRSSRVLVLGDPHPENIGSFRAGDGTLLVEFNDFDACAFGPYHLDVRRLALGVYIAGISAAMSPEGRDAATQQVAVGYLEEIQALLAGAEGVQLRRLAGHGTLVDDLLRRAHRDGGDQEHLNTYSAVDEDGVRHMIYGELDPPEIPGVYADEVMEVSFEERALVEAALAAYPQSLVVMPGQQPYTPEMFALKGISRRLGSGVSNYPVLRYYALVEGPTTDPHDDWLLELKEISDPPAFEGLIRYPLRRFASNAERVVLAQRTLQERLDDDPLLGWAEVPPLNFRVRHRTSYQKGISVSRMAEKLAEGDWTEDDIIAFAERSGRLLARSHALAPTLDADRGLEAIAEALGLSAPGAHPLEQQVSLAEPAGFVEETLLFVSQYGPRVVADYALFVDMVESEGPRLGYRAGRGAVIR
ncbi:MAG: DUF2252 family protein [Bradymonadia bacterium]